MKSKKKQPGRPKAKASAKKGGRKGRAETGALDDNEVDGAAGGGGSSVNVVKNWGLVVGS
jgi:hypothetical protein